MAKFEVNEEERTVVAYKGDLKSEKDFRDVEKYNRVGYTVTLLPTRPKKNHKHIRNDMITYLKGNIDEELYNEFIDRIEKKEKFLVTKWWLEKAFKEKQEDDNKKRKANKEKVKNIETIEDIINRAKSRENKVIEKAIEQAEKENKNKNKDTSNEDK